jgi:AbiJ-like protein
MAFLKRIWDLSAMLSTDSRYSNAERDIWQHTVNFPDWDDAHLLLDRLDLLHCDDQTFLAFLEQTVHPLAISDDNERAMVVATYNRYLMPVGYILGQCHIWRAQSAGAEPMVTQRMID